MAQVIPTTGDEDDALMGIAKARATAMERGVMPFQKYLALDGGDILFQKVGDKVRAIVMGARWYGACHGTGRTLFSPTDLMGEFGSYRVFSGEPYGSVGAASLRSMSAISGEYSDDRTTVKYIVGAEIYEETYQNTLDFFGHGIFHSLPHSLYHTVSVFGEYPAIALVRDEVTENGVSRSTALKIPVVNDDATTIRSVDLLSGNSLSLDGLGSAEWTDFCFDGPAVLVSPEGSVFAAYTALTASTNGPLSNGKSVLRIAGAKGGEAFDMALPIKREFTETVNIQEYHLLFGVVGVVASSGAYLLHIICRNQSPLPPIAEQAGLFVVSVKADMSITAQSLPAGEFPSQLIQLESALSAQFFECDGMLIIAGQQYVYFFDLNTGATAYATIHSSPGGVLHLAAQYRKGFAEMITIRMGLPRKHSIKYKSNEENGITLDVTNEDAPSFIWAPPGGVNILQSDRPNTPYRPPLFDGPTQGNP